MFLATAKKLSINVESLHFPTFSTKRSECKIEKRDGHHSWKIKTNAHGKVMEKHFVDSVGTLFRGLYLSIKRQTNARCGERFLVYNNNSLQCSKFKLNGHHN